MRGKRWKVVIIVAVVVVVVLGTWLGQHLRERRKAAEREVQYQTLLAKYTGELKPGMSREQVERHLQINGKQCKQMCCVANFRTRTHEFYRVKLGRPAQDRRGEHTLVL